MKPHIPIRLRSGQDSIPAAEREKDCLLGCSAECRALILPRVPDVVCPTHHARDMFSGDTPEPPPSLRLRLARAGKLGLLADFEMSVLIEHCLALISGGWRTAPRMVLLRSFPFDFAEGRLRTSG